MNTTTYYAENGRVYVKLGATKVQVHTALGSKGSDLEAYERALEVARNQRDAELKIRNSSTDCSAGEPSQLPDDFENEHVFRGAEYEEEA